MNDGRDAGIKLAKALAAKNTIESLSFYATDLMGSRNVDEWSKALDKMTSLKYLYCVGMMRLRYIQFVDASTFDEKTSSVKHPLDKRQRIYWNNKTPFFPDATMKEEDVQKLKEAATHARKVDIRDVY